MDTDSIMLRWKILSFYYWFLKSYIQLIGNWNHWNWNQIAALDSNEQKILADWYDSLIDKGTLVWDLTNNLCTQTGITCNSLNPPKVSSMYHTL